MNECKSEVFYFNILQVPRCGSANSLAPTTPKRRAEKGATPT